MDPADSISPDGKLCPFDSAGDVIGRLDIVYLNIHYSDTDFCLCRDLFQCLKIAGRSLSQFQHQMIDVQCIEKPNQSFPLALLYRLPSVVAEAEVNGFFNPDLIENPID